MREYLDTKTIFDIYANYMQIICVKTIIPCEPQRSLKRSRLLNWFMEIYQSSKIPSIMFTQCIYAIVIINDPSYYILLTIR